MIISVAIENTNTSIALSGNIRKSKAVIDAQQLLLTETSEIVTFLVAPASESKMLPWQANPWLQLFSKRDVMEFRIKLEPSHKMICVYSASDAV